MIFKTSTPLTLNESGNLTATKEIIKEIKEKYKRWQAQLNKRNEVRAHFSSSKVW